MQSVPGLKAKLMKLINDKSEASCSIRTGVEQDEFLSE